MNKKEEFKTLLVKLRGIDGFDKLVEAIKSTDYMTAPASTKYHSKYEGGLLDHCVGVATNLLEYTEKFNIQWERPESPILIGLFHDWCKVNFYKKSKGWRKDASNKWEQYDTFEVDNKDPLGHGVKSVILLQRILPLTMQEVYCITYHMGAFGDLDYRRDYSAACVKHPEICYVALADQMAGISEELSERSKESD